MKKKKIWKVIPGALVLTGIVAAGGIFGVRYLKSRGGKAVEVVSVGMLNAGDWIGMNDMEGSSGMVTSDVNQNIYLTDDKVVDEVYVAEGDKVKIGDKLMHYDTTILELDQELQEIVVQELELELKSAEADLQKLRNTTPVAKSSSDYEDGDSSLLDMLEQGELYSSAAQMYQTDRTMLASAEDHETPETESTETENAEIHSVEVETDYETEAGEEILTEDVQMMTPDDLDQVPEYVSDQGEKDSKKEEKEQKDISLEGFLDFLRVKEVVGTEESLLADTRNQTGEEPLEMEVTEFGLKLVPHFSEKPDYVFEKDKTYRMVIKGVKLEKELSGKIYGTSCIDGNDYPEIGGFMASKITGEEENTVQVIFAFHDGLDEQHEGDALLQDMYVELPLDAKEVQAGNLILLPDEETISSKIQIVMNKEDILYEDITESQGESYQEDSQEEEIEFETEIQPDTEPETEENWELEEETDSSEDTQPDETGEQKARFQVTWNHGTNQKSQWPKSLQLRFYQGKGSEEPLFTVDLDQQQAKVNGASDDPETEMTEDAVTGTSDETSAGYETGDAEPETEGDDADASQEDTDSVIVDVDDPYPAIEEWTNLMIDWDSQWGESPSEYQYVSTEDEPDKWMEIYWSLEVVHYQPVVHWTLDENGNEICKIEMTYKEPEESPLSKYEPLSVLTYESGENGSYYKGEGTAESPYLFFVTDGVTIKSSFVNWVLGFNAEGTERVGSGYCVMLEIRESDSFAGAFIRKIGLDGTILKETGYAPNIYWIFTSDSGIVRYEEELPDDSGDDDFPGGDYDPGWSDDITYTAEELAEAIAEKEREIRKLNLDKKEAELKLKQYNKELEESTVVSAVNGYVQSLGGTDCYMVIASEEGLYLKTSVSELDLDTVYTGMEITCQSWESGATFTATVTQVDSFPQSGDDNMYSWGTNSNSSNYPVLAVIHDAPELSEYEYVNVIYPTQTSTSGSIYIEKAYIRSENGQSYVYIVGEDGKLKKQYIRTGGNSYGYVEIKEGLKNTDKIAFPYGKNVKEGAAVKHSADEEDVEW
ncbi:MAG: hypothetical protein ACI4EI_13240 [Muricoprocola sp.]